MSNGRIPTDVLGEGGASLIHVAAALASAADIREEPKLKPR